MPNPTGKGGMKFKKGDPRTIECAKKSKRPSLDTRLRERLEGDGSIEEIMDVLQSLALSGDLQAIKELLDRTYGKSKQSIDQTLTADVTIHEEYDLTTLDKDELNLFKKLAEKATNKQNEE